MNINRASRRLSQLVPFDSKRALPVIHIKNAALVAVTPDTIVTNRKAVIFRPPRSAMQAGFANTKQIRLEFDNAEPRWQNGVLGWTASRDAVQGIVLRFASVVRAVDYCRRMGFKYEVRDDIAEGPLVPKLYADNFCYSAKKLKLIRTK
jgi:NADH dehydrogenase (ubiquinone) Fe-S protein 4